MLPVLSFSLLSALVTELSHVAESVTSSIQSKYDHIFLESSPSSKHHAHEIVFLSSCKQQIFFVQNYRSVLSTHKGKESLILFVISLNQQKVIHSFFQTRKMAMMEKEKELFCLSVHTEQKWPYKDRMARIEQHKYFKKLFSLHRKQRDPRQVTKLLPCKSRCLHGSDDLDFGYSRVCWLNHVWSNNTKVTESLGLEDPK